MTVANHSENKLLHTYQGLFLLLIVAAGMSYFILRAPGYTFGQFDEDAHHALLARSLAAGQGYVDHAQPDDPVEMYLPPGYSLLLTPAAFLFPNSVVALQTVSLLSALAAIVLTYVYGRLKGLSIGLSLLATLIVALNPWLGFYATAVLPEAAFLAAVLLLLIALHYYERAERPVGPATLAAVACLAGLFYLKAAALPIMAAVILYLALIRKPRHALFLLGGLLLVCSPLLLSRAALGAPLLGGDFQAVLGVHYGSASGGPSVQDTIIGNLYAYFSQILSDTLAPSAVGSLLPGESAAGVALEPTLSIVRAAVAVLVTLLLIAGWRFWWQRHRDASSLIVPIYLGAALIWPRVDERTTFLLLPVFVFFLMVGLSGTLLESLPRVGIVRPIAYSLFAAALVAFGAVLTARYTRELNDIYRQPAPRLTLSSNAAWIQFLRTVPRADALVAADMPHTYYLLTGLDVTPALDKACQPLVNRPEDILTLWDVFRREQPRYVLIGGQPSRPERYSAAVELCLRPFLLGYPSHFTRVASYAPNIELYAVNSTDPDSAPRTNLISGVPRYSTSVRDVVISATPSPDYGQHLLFASGGRAQITVPLREVARIDTIAIGQAGSVNGAPNVLRVQIAPPGAAWETVDTLVNTQIGSSRPANGVNRNFYYLKLALPRIVGALRLEFEGDGWFYLRDLAVLGTALGSGERMIPPQAATAMETRRTWLPVGWPGTPDNGNRASVAVTDGQNLFLPTDLATALPLDVTPARVTDVDVPVPLVGRWAGVDHPAPGLYYGGVFSLQMNDAVRRVRFGVARGDLPVVGDWDGDGITTYGVLRGGRFYLTNQPAGNNGIAEIQVPVDVSGQVTPLAGDWDGDGRDFIGVHTGNTFILWNEPGGPPTSIVFGLMDDIPVVGDWDGDGKTNVGVIRDGRLLLRGTNGNLIGRPSVLRAQSILPLTKLR